MNASELISKSIKVSTLPESGGSKEYAPEPGRIQNHVLSQTLSQYDDLLHEERICKTSNLSVAEWNVENSVAIVTVPKGSIFKKFGHQNRQGLFLNPEEALFLVDQGLLELRYQQLPLSVHEAYILILPLLPSYEYYQVFSYLCKLGYVVTEYRQEDAMQSVSKWGRAPPSPTQCEKQLPAIADKEPMISGPVTNLWTENEIPCLKPQNATSTSSVLSKIQIFPVMKFQEVTLGETGIEGKYKIDFDVFISKDVKKSELGIPHFRIVVCKYSDSPPSLLETASLSNESKGVNIKLAVVNQGTVSFYGLFDTDLPTLISPLG